MSAQFAPKTATLVANLSSTLQWGNAEFSATLGQDQGMIKSPIGIAMQVVNNTGQVCYIGLQYTTDKTDYSINAGKSIAAIPANSSLAISSKTVPALAAIGPNIKTITMSLISAASGTVVVNLIADKPGDMGGSGSGLFGLDDRSIQDYIIKPQSNITQVGPGVTSSIIYTVPSGKRAFIESYYASIEQTPVFDDYIRAELIINTVNTYLRLFSSYMMPVKMNLDARFLVLEAGDIMELKASCSGANGSNFWVTQLAVVKEVF